jgi:hypothetical protein
MAKQYEAARQLAQLTCENCHVQILVDVQDIDSVNASKEWIMIVPSNGQKIAAHNKDCAMKIVHKLPVPEDMVIPEQPGSNLIVER